MFLICPKIILLKLVEHQWFISAEKLTLHFYSSLEILGRKASIVAETALTQSEVS